MALHVKATDRKWIDHGLNHRQKFIGIFQFVTNKMYFWQLWDTEGCRIHQRVSISGKNVHVVYWI